MNEDITESEFGAILHCKWEEDPHEENIIIGYWAEDNSKYTIDVPKQLRHLIIRIQNWLCEKFQNIESSKRDVQKFTTFFYGLKKE